MCDSGMHFIADPSRRTVMAGLLGGLLGTVSVGSLAPGSASAASAPTPAGQPPIRPRSDWASGLSPTGPLQPEDEVKFLLVHHTQSPNGYAQEDVPRILRGFFGYHTSSDKGWPDIAYNFLIDAYGTIWEGRSGSLAGPVRGDATGGSQGFAQLCCFIGDHTSQPPTPAAQSAMSAVLAWLATRHGVNLQAGPTITFTSRGSNKWPAGSVVTTDPVAGHRDMSSTECPGDACYPLVRGALLAGAQQLMAAATPAPQSTSAPASEAATPSASEPATPEPSGRTADDRDEALAKQSPPPAESSEDDGGLSPVTIGAAVGGAAAAVGVGAYFVHASRQRDTVPDLRNPDDSRLD